MMMSVLLQLVEIVLNLDALKTLFQLSFTRFLGGPIGGICCVASAPYASAMRCG